MSRIRIRLLCSKLLSDKNIVQFLLPENAKSFICCKYNNKVPVELIIGLSVGEAAVAAAGIATAVVITKKKNRRKSDTSARRAARKKPINRQRKRKNRKSSAPENKREKSK